MRNCSTGLAHEYAFDRHSCPGDALLVGGVVAERGYQVVVVLFCLIHLLLLANDINRPDAFLVADRGVKRLAKIEALHETLQNGDSLSALFVATGDPGDYLFHGLIYGLAGREGVMVVQIGLGLVGVTYLYLLARLLTGDPRTATLAAILYILLPASIYYPHVLLTEGIFNPLLIASIYYLALYLQSEEHKFIHLAASGLLLTIPALIRLVALPIVSMVLVLLLVLAVCRRVRWQHILGYAVVAQVIPLALMGFYYVNTGSFSMGDSDHSLNWNLAVRIGRISRMEKIDPHTVLGNRREASAGEYVAFALEHPLSYTKMMVSDLVNLMLNPGTNTLLGRYLKLYEMPEESDFFTRVRDQGLTAFTVTILTYSPLLALTNVLSLILWLAFLVAAVVGLYLLARDAAIHWSVRVLLIGLLIYNIAAMQLVGGVSYRHRTPFEFILVIAVSLAVMALSTHHRQGNAARFCGEQPSLPTKAATLQVDGRQVIGRQGYHLFTCLPVYPVYLGLSKVAKAGIAAKKRQASGPALSNDRR